jgi:integrase
MARPRQDGSPSTAPNRQRLSHFAVKNLKPQERPFAVWDTVQRGLAITVQPSGSMAWKTVYAFHGRPRWLHLADASAIGLADARKLANEIMYKVAQGLDPAAERRASRSADTFADLAGRYLKYSESRNKSWRQAAGLVRKHLLPRWGKLRAMDVSRSDVNAMVASIAAPITANQVLASASAIFTWAVKKEVAGIKLNPCAGVERNKTTSRERVLSDSEIPLFWSAFNSAGLREGRALRLVLLLGQRPGEIANMRSEHIEGNWWTMPGDPVPALAWPGTKNAQSHRVFLPAPAQQIIAEMDTTGRIFGSLPVAYLSSAMRAICGDLGVERATPHDLRRTNGTTITGLGFGRDAMDRIQNHKKADVTSIYDRYGYAQEDQRVMEAVSSRILQLAENGSPNNVFTFKKAM